jgi:hypothetical protein
MARDCAGRFLRIASRFVPPFQRMIDWQPQRITIAHGQWYCDNGLFELRRPFRWAL